MDEFRKQLDKRSGKSGVHCYCCNMYIGKHRKVLNRLVRRTLKQKWNSYMQFKHLNHTKV
jgi:hypothetical protein